MNIFECDNNNFSKKLILKNRNLIENNIIDLTLNKSINSNLLVEVLYMKKILNSNKSLKAKLNDFYILFNFSAIGLYSYKDNKIIFNLDKFIDGMNFNNLSYEELRLVKNIYHELHHQLQWFNNKEIFNISFNKYYNYFSFHDFYEFEIDAEIESRKRLILDIENNEYPELKKYLKVLNDEISLYENKRHSEIYKYINK